MTGPFAPRSLTAREVNDVARLCDGIRRRDPTGVSLRTSQFLRPFDASVGLELRLSCAPVVLGPFYPLLRSHEFSREATILAGELALELVSLARLWDDLAGFRPGLTPWTATSLVFRSLDRPRSQWLTKRRPGWLRDIPGPDVRAALEASLGPVVDALRHEAIDELVLVKGAAK